MFALIAVAAIGVVSLQDRGVQDFATQADVDIASDDFAVEEQTPLGDFADDGDDASAAAEDMDDAPASTADFEVADDAEEAEIAMADEAETSPQDTEADALAVHRREPPHRFRYKGCCLRVGGVSGSAPL